MDIGGHFVFGDDFLCPSQSINIHHDALPLSTGRACLNLIVSIHLPKRVHIPFYSCDTLLEPFLMNDVRVIYYEIDENFEIKSLDNFSEGDMLLYINYFGIKNSYAESLVKKFAGSTIIDNSQQYFSNGYSSGYSFVSARKFFAVPDGAFLYSMHEIDISNYPSNVDVDLNYLFFPMFHEGNRSLDAFHKNEKLLSSEIKGPSQYSERILEGLNLERVSTIRKENFDFLSDRLISLNQLSFASNSGELPPFCYPFLHPKEIDKDHLVDEGFYIPSYWSDVNNRDIEGFEFEKTLSKHLLPLPVDHRYSQTQLVRLVDYLLRV